MLIKKAVVIILAGLSGFHTEPGVSERAAVGVAGEGKVNRSRLLPAQFCLTAKAFVLILKWFVRGSSTLLVKGKVLRPGTRRDGTG